MSTSPNAAGRRPFDSFLLLPAAVAALLLAAGNEDFGFDPAGGLDAFAYLGYFWHYPEHAGALADAYKSSRLPWILPGYVLHSILGPVAGQYVLVFATLSAGGVALYLLLRDVTRDRPAAATLCVAWTSCTWLHGIGGWSYQVLPAANYYLFGLWLTFRAARQHSRWAAVLAGVCVICAVHTHLFFAAFLPLIPLMYWSGLPSDGGMFGRARADALRAVAGALGITAALTIVNVATGGKWLFFAPQMALTQQLLEKDRWWHDAATWLPVAIYLIVPVVFLIGALTALLVSRAHRQSQPARTLVLQAWLAFGIMCVTQFGAQITTLDYSYMAFPLYAYAFPAGGVVLASWHARQSRVAVLVSSAIIVGFLLFLMPAQLPAAMAQIVAATMGTGQMLVLPPLLLALLGCAAMLVAPPRVRLVVFGIWFGALNAWIAPSPPSYGIDTPGYRRQMFELFYELDGVTAAYDPSLEGIHYWFDGSHVPVAPGSVPLPAVFGSFAALRGGEQILVGHDPAVPLTQLDLNNLAAAECIAVLTSVQMAERTEADWHAHYASLGRPLRRVAVRHFTRPDIAFAVTLLKPADARYVGGPPCRRRVLPSARTHN